MYFEILIISCDSFWIWLRFLDFIKIWIQPVTTKDQLRTVHWTKQDKIDCKAAADEKLYQFYIRLDLDFWFDFLKNHSWFLIDEPIDFQIESFWPVVLWNSLDQWRRVHWMFCLPLQLLVADCIVLQIQVFYQ